VWCSGRLPAGCWPAAAAAAPLDTACQGPLAARTGLSGTECIADTRHRCAKGLPGAAVQVLHACTDICQCSTRCTSWACMPCMRDGVHFIMRIGITGETPQQMGAGCGRLQACCQYGCVCRPVMIPFMHCFVTHQDLRDCVLSSKAYTVQPSCCSCTDSSVRPTLLSVTW
jgi:hypothetical protein